MALASAHVRVLTTGGTIASRHDATGALSPTDDASAIASLIAEQPGARDVAVTVNPVCQGLSFAFTLADLATIATAAHKAAAHQETTGVVVTHGTDTLEETAMLLDLTARAGAAPIVLTGAQRPADSSNPDGPTNLADAIVVASDPGARERGPLVVFDSLVLPARGVRKVNTLASRAFDMPDGGPLGFVRDGTVDWVACPVARALAPLPTPAPERLGATVVDIVSSYPGADGRLLREAARTAAGIVLVGTGAGNATPALTAAAQFAVEGGVVVALASRTAAGPVAPLYAGGGGADLVAAGVLPAGRLAAAQARIVLAACLAAGRPVTEIARLLVER